MSNGQCTVSHALRANDPFGKYKPETQQPVRKLKVQGDETLRELKKVFKRFLRKKIKETQERGFFTEQDVAKEMIRGIFVGLKYGVPVDEYIKEFEFIRCQSPAMDFNPVLGDSVEVLSCSDAIAKVLKRELSVIEGEK